MEDKSIKDNQITASSYYNDPRNKRGDPKYGRLNTKASPTTFGSWLSMVSSRSGEYLQVDLLKHFVVSRIATQGRNGDTNWPRWVTKYFIKYSNNVIDWSTYPKV